MPEKNDSVAPALLKTYIGHKYRNPDGSVDGERLLRVVQDAPGAFDLMVLGDMAGGGRFTDEHHWMVQQIVGRLTFLVMMAAFGDKKSATQIKAVEKILNPEKYELPQTKIEELVDRYETSPPLARGWELRRLMSQLASVVQPLKKGGEFTESQPVKLIDDPPDYLARVAELARSHWKPNTTLQSLAIRIYLKELQEKGITDAGEAITDRSLKRDLAKVREWESNASEDEKLRRREYKGHLSGGDFISWYEFSEGWKVRRMKRSEAAKGANRDTE